MTFLEWLQKTYRKHGKYQNNRFGDLAKNLTKTVKQNPFEEDFKSYDTLEDWLRHLDMHIAPESAVTTMVEAWDAYTSQGLSAELDCIRGESNEVSER